VSYDLHAVRRTDTPPPEDERREMDRIASAIQAEAPGLTRFDGSGFVQLDGDRLQAHVYHDEVTLTVPYWFDGEDAEQALDAALACAQVLRRAGFTVEDPQTGRPVDDTTTGAELLPAYAPGRETTRRLESPPAAPWKIWRRWKGS
jgi:hypothetical protein